MSHSGTAVKKPKIESQNENVPHVTTRRRKTDCSQSDTDELQQQFASPHPLLIHHVTEQVLGYLSYSKLKNCRLVCRIWNEAAAKHFKEKSVLVFNTEETLNTFLDARPDDNLSLHSSFRFSVNIDPFKEGFKEFTQKFGHHARYLRFDKQDFLVTYGATPNCPDVETYQLMNLEEMSVEWNHPRQREEIAESFQFKFEFPKLKIFRFNGNVVEEPFQQWLLPRRYIIGLLERCQNLKKLSSVLGIDRRNVCPNSNEEFVPNSGSLLIGCLRRFEVCTKADATLRLATERALASQGLRQLSELELNCPILPFHLQEMKSVTLQLRSLHFCIFTGQYQDLTQAITEFFAHNCDSLTSLRVTFGRVQPLRFEIQSLILLKNLAVHGCTYPVHLRFIRGCPALENIHLVQCTVPHNFQEIVVLPPLENLKSFIAHDVKIIGRRRRARFVLMICENYKFLKKLKLEFVTDDSLGAICQNLKELVELNILSAKITDAGVTGISIPTLKSRSMSAKKEQSLKKRRPYIGDLKNLRVLEIGSTGMTDLSISYGVLNCKSLRNVTIFSPKITGRGLRSIVDNLDLIALRTVCCYGLPDSALEYARKKFNDPENVVLNVEKGPKTDNEVARIIRKHGIIHTRTWKT